MPFAIFFDVMLIVMSLPTQLQKVSFIGEIIGWQGVVILGAIGMGALLYFVLGMFENYERLILGKAVGSKEKLIIGKPDRQKDLNGIAVSIFIILMGLMFFFW